MIKIKSTQLEKVIKSLELNNQVRVNSKYLELLNHMGEENKEKVEKLISAYIFQYLIKNNLIVENLLCNNDFLDKVCSMTDEQINSYIELSTKVVLGILLTSKTLLSNYTTEEHLRICELHLIYYEDHLLASIIELAAKYKVKFLYIKKIAEMVANPKIKDKYAIDLLLKEKFYAVKSDFERLIILECITKTDNEYEKSLYRYLASNEIFVKNNDIYYLIDLVEKLIKLNNKFLSDQLITEINGVPSITKVYSPEDLFVIMNRIGKDARVQYFFFNPFILANFKTKDINTIYNLAILNDPESIMQILIQLEKYIKEGKDVISELQIFLNKNTRKQDTTDVTSSNNTVSLSYKISANSEWIDA